MATNQRNDDSGGNAGTPSQGGMSVREAGQRGGEATSASHDRAFYEEIGHKGGEKGGQPVSELVEKGRQAEGGRGDDNR